MEKIKEIWKEIVEKYKNQKTELLLMLIFIAAGICLGAGEISQEAVSVNTAGAAGQADETGEQGKLKSGENAETQDDDTDAPDSSEEESSMEQEDSSEEADTGKQEESSENLSEENDTENVTEEEAGPDEEEALEVMRRYDRRRRAALGRDFIIPMAMPEGYVRPEYDAEIIADNAETEVDAEIAAGDAETEDDADIMIAIDNAEENTETLVEISPAEQTAESDEDQGFLTVYTLQDTRELYEYELLVEADEAELFAEVQLEAVLRRRIASYDGDWSVYVKNLKTDQTILINDRPMKSASVMKLFILGTMYKAFESGDMERTDEIMSLMNDMIVYSSNEASNELLYRLGDSDYSRGIAKVNEFIQEYGFSDMTVEYNGFDDPATNTGTGNYNQVSAKDCGKLLEDIYHREWVNRSVSNEIEQMMLNQNTRYKIPAGLPEGVSCGNKSGEMDATENDAAIVYADSCDYILVVLSSDWSSKDEAISRIQSISSLVYQHLAE